MNTEVDKTTPKYTIENDWNGYLQKVTKSSDGIYTAILVSYDSYENKRIERTYTYTLKENSDKSLCFISGKVEWINNHLVSLSGNYTKFEKINGYDGDLGDLLSVGEIDGRMLLCSSEVDSTNSDYVLMLFNPVTSTAEKVITIKIDDPNSYYGIKLFNDKIVVKLADKLIVISRDLKHQSEQLLPKTVADKISRKTEYDNNGIQYVFFSGYDVTEDLKKFVYTDEIGVIIYDVSSGKESILAKTVKINTKIVIDSVSYYSTPRFVCDETKVITTMCVYEGTSGYKLINIPKKTTVDLDSYNAFTDNIFYDTGVLSINDRNSSSEYKSYYTDFITGERKEINLKDIGNTNNLVPKEHLYVGKNYAAFVIYDSDNNGMENSTYHINRLNLKTLEIENDVVISKAADIKILGITDDGRIVFNYSYNPSECGNCITGEPAK